MPLPHREDIVYGSTKCYSASIGLSAAFRQWRADSHCNRLHGYALEFVATFEATELDMRNWVVDFGSLKSFKGWLEETFDHTLVVAQDDPALPVLQQADMAGLCSLRVVEATGCEAFARLAFEYMELWLMGNGYSPRVTLVKMEVREHTGNSAYVRRKV